MQEFIQLHVHSHYTLLEGLSKPNQIAERVAQLKYKACSLTDNGTISGAIQFIKALKDACNCGHSKNIHDTGKKCKHKNCGCEEFQPCGVKPILGSELYITEKPPEVKDQSNRKTSNLVVLAKNLQGWRQLIQIVSYANSPDHVWYKRPRIHVDKIAELGKGQLIAYSGYLGSNLASSVFADPALAYKAETYEQAKALVIPEWKSIITELAGKHIELFGKENFYLNVQLLDQNTMPAAQIVAKIMRWLGNKLDIPCIASANSYYPRKEDDIDQRILLCTKLKTTTEALRNRVEREDPSLLGFTKKGNYHIPALDEMSSLHTPEELLNTIKIAEQCEVYDVLSKNPILPDFPCPDGLSSSEYLTKLCEQGWNTKLIGKQTDEYKERYNHELKVILDANLAGYFLIVQDYINYAKSNGWLVGSGRGSSAGSLVSYLIDITSIDPIEYGLLFERFYNSGRNTKDRISLPDIDSDFPKQYRDNVKDYIYNKFGHDKVSQMITFGRMQGRSAIKDVFRAYGNISFDLLNRISKNIPQEASIADKLQLMKERDGESSIIRWTLENDPAALKEWCYINDDGELEGEYAPRFAQAIRLEGTKKTSGKHPSGIVMSPVPLAEICPMVYDKSEDSVVAGFEMFDLEAIGLVKFDILGVAVLDKLMGVKKLLETGSL
jgi:DNA polymerase-3 subunit alpha